MIFFNVLIMYFCRILSQNDNELLIEMNIPDHIYYSSDRTGYFMIYKGNKRLKCIDDNIVRRTPYKKRRIDLNEEYFIRKILPNKKY